MSTTSPERQRLRLTIQGIVQGVGFRPFVYGLAQQYHLAGHVGNNGEGVFIEIEGTPEDLAQFQSGLLNSLPPLARLDSVQVESIAPTNDHDFVIVASQASDQLTALLPPDIAICEDCLRELLDPTNRRYHYPFINCTNCGPRFTIIQGIPYDRPKTTMADFEMCPDCAAEYHDPLNRRFHAQPNACPVCGPHLWFQTHSGEVIEGDDAITLTKQAFANDQIIAVKGIGGFHLACDARSDTALRILRERKGRVDKPFAIMVRDLEMARQLAEINPAEVELLESPQRPIVLLKKRQTSTLSELVAPGNQYVGVMLAYAPLHYLLLDDYPLVMTSGNFSGEPICKDNADALHSLTPLVDGFLLHNRPIHTACDDSVLRIHDQDELPIRRSRGYTPFPVKLPFDVATVLATGGELKNTFCLTHHRHAFLSQHIGDMENIETLNAFTASVEHFSTLYRLQPEAVICDLHPNYLTTTWSHEYASANSLLLIQVQHHHAHIAAVLAEHGDTGQSPIIGVCLDGTGYGTDGAIWGGEFLLADYAHFERVAHLKYVPLAGGDAAVKKPYRVALAHLWSAGIEWEEWLPPVVACPTVEQRILARQFETSFNTVPTSSMGRLFDAVAALIGVRQIVSYEAQAAIELESMATMTDKSYSFVLEILPDTPIQLDASPVFRAIVDDLQQGVSQNLIAGKFHRGVADVILKICDLLRQKTGIHRVALSGGVFQNVLLLALTSQALTQSGFEVLVHRAVPPNDGGLALGQAIIGAKQIQMNRKEQ
ncbi:MAG: carbamoyltransferase [Chloroflexota bacterium]|nr:carbamoyltransferase HypF [Chloroflexota bacterium]NOG65544.1 carbamoyltransferase HypF [Chloroflexota bacterium]GIK65304.1 MAG: carbamoyltransferase [Chloroflexota bacterium]